MIRAAGGAAMPSPSPLFSDEFQHEPAKVIARLRADDPVHYVSELDVWYVTRWDDVRELFTHPDATNDQRAFQHYVPRPEGSYLRWISENGLFSAPPEQHARTRRLVTGTFTPRAVARMDAQIRDVVEQFAAPLRGAKGVVDLVATYTAPIPSTVIGRITGVPPKANDEVRFRQLARDVISGISPLLPPADRARAESAILELCDYVRGLAAERRREPREDLISDLVCAHEDPMTNEEIILLVAALVAAGTETTAMGGALGLRALLQHPDQLALVRRDRSLLPNAVREILRFDFGSAGLPRYALRDFELRGRRIRKGQLLLLSFMGAHRDPEVFPDPDRFDVRRDTSSLTIFGHGPHYCIGANLAQAELRQIFDAALDFLPEHAVLREDQIQITRLGMFSRLETLPVDFGA
jgi:cytochrome P450